MFKRIRHVSVPQIRPALVFVIVINTIGTMQLLDIPFLIYGAGNSSGPNNSATTLVIELYQFAFSNVDLGPAAALGWLLTGMTREPPKRWQQLIVWIILPIALVIFIAPLRFTLIWSTWDDSGIFSFPPKLLPGSFLGSNLRGLEAATDIWHALVNSVIVGVVTAGSAVLFGSAAGYAFAKFRFRFQNVIFYLFMATLAVPIQITAIPLFVIRARLGWVNTYQAVIIPALTPALALFFMWATVAQVVTPELLEAARLDGAGGLRILVRIVWPMIRSNATALGILLFGMSWSNLFWPHVVLRTSNMATLLVALAELIGTYQQPYGQLITGAALGTIVPIVIFIALRGISFEA